MSIKDRLRDPTLLVERASVAGAWIGGATGGTIPVVNPATGEAIATVPDLGAGETRDAIAAAERAWPAWRARPAAERSALLERWHDLMLENLEDLAVIMTASRASRWRKRGARSRYGASFVKWFAEEARRVYGEVIPAPTADRRIVVLKEPVGVSVAITPWNFPNAMITRKAAPALAAGCPMVVKPSEFTPLSALALAVLAERAGIPPGVLSVVTGMSAGIGGEMTGKQACASSPSPARRGSAVS